MGVGLDPSEFALRQPRATTLPGVNTDPPTDADLAALLDDERAQQAARDRAARRWLQQQALEEAQLSGVLLGAAEHHHVLTLQTTSGRTHTGTVTAVGSDFCGIRTADAEVYVRLSAIAVLQPDRAIEALPAGDDRRGPLGLTFNESLAGRAPDRPDVALVCAGQPRSIPGRLLAVGTDVASLEVDDRRTIAYVSLASVTEVSLRASG